MRPTSAGGPARPPALVLVIWLAACTPPPDLPAAGDAPGPAPALLPTATLAAATPGVPAEPPEAASVTGARAAALRARAQRLQGPVVPPEDAVRGGAVAPVPPPG